jgi:hypothetical protein
VGAKCAVFLSCPLAPAERNEQTVSPIKSGRFSP